MIKPNDPLRGRDYQLDEGETLVMDLLMKVYDTTYDEIKIKIARDSNDDRALADVATSIASQWDWDSPFETPVLATEEGFAALLGSLGAPLIARAFLSTVRYKPDPPYPALALAALTEWAGEIAPRKTWPALLWLRSNAHIMLGAVERAEADLLAADSLDGQWPFIPEWLARYACDRGDVEHGLTLLQRAQVTPDHPLLTILQGLQAPKRTDLGRNDRCWCGSGRKYKVCHLHREQLPLAERAYWLQLKSTIALYDNPQFTEQVVEAAKVLDGQPDALQAGDVHPLAPDVVLFEGGAFNEFVARRGYLLPEDELGLARQWQSVKRAVHELISVRPGESVTLRNANTGELAEVREQDPNPQLKVGALYCARVVQAGNSMQVLSPMVPVPRGKRDHLVNLLDGEPEPMEVIAALEHRRA